MTANTAPNTPNTPNTPDTTNTLLCLDLNGTVLYRNKNTRSCICRPFLQEFLSQAVRFYDVAVWSSGTKTNMDSLVRDLFREHYDELVFKFYRNNCDIAPSKEKPWATQKNLSSIPFQYDSIIMVDDSDDKIIGMRENDFHYKILKYKGDNNDFELQILMDFIITRLDNS